MSAAARRGILAGALSTAAGWLIEPAEPAATAPTPAPLEARPVVAVIGLAPRCGATTVARALGADLATRDLAGACAVTSAGAGAVPLGMPAAARLARSLSPLFAGRARACGRLCLVEGAEWRRLADAARYLAPLVLDVDDPVDSAAAAALADHVLLVGSPATEPALAAVLADSLARVGSRPVPVLNRADEHAERWHGRAVAELPDSRMGAQLALAGRGPRGGLARAVGGLADRCEVAG